MSHILIFCCFCLPAIAQDPIFSQYYLSPLQLNPAFAGNTRAPKIAINYRNQWPEIAQAYSTYSLSYDQFFPRLNSGFGVLLLSDDAGNGLFKTTKAAGVYTYQIKIDRDLYAKFGVEAGFVQSRYNWSKFIFPDQVNAETGYLTPGGTPWPTEETVPDKTNLNYMDVSFGLLVYSSNFYGGLTIKHINTPSQSILENNTATQDGLPIRISIHAGSEIPLFGRNSLLKKSFVAPNLMIVKQGPFIQAIGGTFLGYDPFFLGIWYRMTKRNADAAIFSAGLQKGIFKISYSFDLTVSSLTIRSGGSHEVGILLNLDSLYPEESKYNDCFQIFR